MRDLINIFRFDDEGRLVEEWSEVTTGASFASSAPRAGDGNDVGNSPCGGRDITIPTAHPVSDLHRAWIFRWNPVEHPEQIA